MTRTGGSDPDDVHLSPRQWQVARRVAAGFSQKRIAHEFGISPSTVNAHVQAVAAKLPGEHDPVYRIVTWWARRAQDGVLPLPWEGGGSEESPKLLRTGLDIPPYGRESGEPSTDDE